MSTLAPTVAAAPHSVAVPGFFRSIADALVALGEGFAAYQRYERLRARGIPHAEAAAKSFS